MKKNRLAMFIGVVLLFEAVCPATALAIGPLYTVENLVYTYPDAEITLIQGEPQTHQMRYVNQFFNPDGTYSKVKGEALKKWLDMSVRNDVLDRTDSGYLLLEQEHEFQNGFWQKLGYGYVWSAEKVSATIGSFGINLLVDWGNHEAYKSKFGEAGAYAVPYYELLSQTYLSFLESLEKERQTVDEAVDIVSNIVKPVYGAIEANVNRIDVGAETVIFEAPKASSETLAWEVQEFELGGDVNVHTNHPQILGDTLASGLKHNMTTMKVKVGQEIRNITVDNIAEANLNAKKVVLSFEGLDDKAKNSLIASLKSDMNYVYTPEVEAGYMVKWSDRCSATFFGDSVEKLLQSQSGADLSDAQREALEQAAQTRKQGVLNPSRKEFDAWGKRLGLLTDFTTAATSWYNVYVKRKNLTLQQELYTCAFSQVSEEHLDMLWDWHDSVQADSNLEANEKKYIESALYALAYDIAQSRNGLMEEVINKNTDLGSVGSVIQAISDTSELIVTASGIGMKDVLANSKFMSMGTTKAVGGGGIMLAGALTNYLLNAIGAQGYLSSRKTTDIIYDLKKSITDHTFKLLDAYATNRNHADAVAIINSLYMIRQLKLAGEEYISLLYLSDAFDKKLGTLPPEVTAILWNELYLRDSFHINEDVKSYITPVWGLYENSVGKMDLNEQGLEYETRRVPVYYELVSTVLKYYHKGTDVVYQNTKLQAPPEWFEYIGKTMWKLPDELYGRSVKLKWHTYTGENDGTWRDRSIPLDIDFNKVHKEDAYLYQRGDAEVFIRQSVFDEYYTKAQAEVDRLLNEYSSNFNDLDAKDHQLEERMMWANVTRDYINAIDMYDPQGIYP